MNGEDTKAVVGDVIDGRYRLLSMLGQGGMGQVFRAEHVGIKREVAIKLLHHELRDNEAVQERVTREAFATGRLDHPNCVSITDSGTFGNGGTYIVMELLKGDSLGDVLDEQETLPLAEALAIIRDILKGLEHAHEAGVVHRDLKPDNIFLVQSKTQKRVTKILDFGIAKLLGDAKVEAGGGDLTEAGMAIGSPTYMSPEQATGEAIDGRTDLFTVSLILYEMIAGDPPFYEPDDKVRSLQRRLKEQAPPMVSARGEVIPSTLEALVQAGLEKNPEHRVASAGDYRKRLERIVAELSGEGAQVTPTTALLPRLSEGAPLPQVTTQEAEGLSPEVVRKLKYGGAALLAVVVLIAAIAALSGGSEAAESSEETLAMDPMHLDDAITVDPRVLAAQLEQELNHLDREVGAGRGAQYIQPLKRLHSLWPTHARTNYLLGLAYMEKRYWGDGYKYLREAVRLDESLRSDPALIKAAIRSLSSRSKPELGENFLVQVVGESSILLLQETVRGGSTRQKEYANRALQRLGAEPL